ncbi:MAG TPA: cobalamin-independent methionine synthase II family protein [Acidimicrobiales bacterium]|jgi:5-methyltetrahydropteroyltriglutamate--homocysteine methyltransferase|nr:cobalamin-independent methionine synthase II family protein [Acidimicrobiales bacterium]
MFHADHVGSLLRPGFLLEARRAHADGSLTDAELRGAEDRAVLAALEGQERVGLPIFTDGELRRGSWVTDMAEAVEGFVSQSRMVTWHGPEGGQEPSTSKVVGSRLVPHRGLTALETGFLADHAPGPVKVTLPAASNFYVVGWMPGVTDQAYASRAEMMADVVSILRAEVEALVDAGVSYIQMDSPYYASFMDEAERERLVEAGVDPDDGLSAAVAADNACFAGVGGEHVVRALHVCRGNSRSRWLAEGTYDVVAESLFGGLDVDRLLLEYDAPRHGDFSPLRFVPEGTTVVLGLVTTKEGALEGGDDLLRRIDDAARYVPMDRLALSPQCGFASVAEGNRLSEEDQWRKLELVVATAAKAWG